MALSAFSPDIFLSMATGEPIEVAHAMLRSEEEPPQSGLREIDTSGVGSSVALWIHGVVGPTRQRDAFIQALERREIPTPIESSFKGLSITRAHYLPLETLQTRAITLTTLLGLTPRLVDEAARSRVGMCLECGTSLTLFHSANQLSDEIARVWRGKAIHITLRGPHSTLAEWADQNGLTPPLVSGESATLRLDSFTCDEARCQLLQPLLAATRRCADTWIHVNDSTGGEDYAWNGRCTQCGSMPPPFKRTLALEALTRGDLAHAPHEISRSVWGLPLADLLTLTMEELATLSASPSLLAPLQLKVLNALGLGRLTLSSVTSSLPPHIITRLPLLSFAGLTPDRGEILVLDSPLDLFSPAEEDAFRAMAQEVATIAPTVWLRDKRASEALSVSPPEANGTHIGTLTLPDEPSLPSEIRCGDLCMVSATGRGGIERIAHHILHTIRGGTSPLISFTARNPFSEHLIPLFAIDSSHTRLVAHELGAMEPFAKLFAVSHQAKMLGLSPRDFIIGQARHSASVCVACKGSGFQLSSEELLPATAAPCSLCWGTRFRSPIRDVSFKGRTLWEFLNTPLKEISSTVRALPKMRESLALAELFDITPLALGMPTILLPRATRRLLSIIRAILAGTKSRPSLIILEEPLVGLTAKQVEGLTEAISNAAWRDKVAWIGVVTR